MEIIKGTGNKLINNTVENVAILQTGMIFI